MRESHKTSRFVVDGRARVRAAEARAIRERVWAEFEPQVTSATGFKRLILKYRRWQRAQIEIENLDYRVLDEKSY